VSARPHGSCRRHENVENQKRVSHIFTAPWKTRRRKNMAASFPQLPQGLLLGPFQSWLKKPGSRASAVSIQ